MGTSLKKLSQIVGVSPVTVYRAVSGKGYVKPELRERIRQLAKKHRYEPNMLTRGLLKGKTKTIGVIATDISSPHIAMDVQGAVCALEEHGYRVSLFCSKNDPAVEFGEIRQAAMRRVEGIMMFPCSDAGDSGHFEEILARGIPTVLVSMPMKGVAFDVFTGDDEFDGYRLTRKLIECGHRKIAHMPIPVEMSHCKRRTAGWQRAMLEINEHPEKWILNADRTGGWEGIIEQQLRSSDPPTAVFAAYESQVGDIYRVADRLNLKIGRDLSVATFFAGSGYSAAREFPPYTSGMIGPSHELGKLAAVRLLELIDMKRKDGSLCYKGKVTKIPGEWFEGGSIADLGV